MARPGFTSHPKFRRLCATLELPAPYALGHCECLWSVAYEHGNAVIGDAFDVELAAQWQGERGVLAKALHDCRLIDEHDGKFAIHDLFDHAPDYVRVRSEKEAERKKVKHCQNSNCGREYRSTETHAKYCGDACRVAAFRNKQNSNATDDNATPTPTTPTPEPAAPAAPAANGNQSQPASDPTPPITATEAAKPTRKRRPTPTGEPEGFAVFWSHYPRKEAKQPALKAWAKLNPDPEKCAVIMAGLARYKVCAQWSDPTKVPYPATFLNQERWDGTPPNAVVAASTATTDPYEEMWEGMKLKGKALRESIAKMYPPKPPAVTPAPAEPAFVG